MAEQRTGSGGGTVAQRERVDTWRRPDCRGADRDVVRASRCVYDVDDKDGAIAPRAAVIGAQHGAKTKEAVDELARVGAFAARRLIHDAIEDESKLITSAVDRVAIVGVIDREAHDHRRVEATGTAADDHGRAGGARGASAVANAAEVAVIIEAVTAGVHEHAPRACFGVISGAHVERRRRRDATQAQSRSAHRTAVRCLSEGAQRGGRAQHPNTQRGIVKHPLAFVVIARWH